MKNKSEYPFRNVATGEVQTFVAASPSAACDLLFLYQLKTDINADWRPHPMLYSLPDGRFIWRWGREIDVTIAD